MDLPIRAGWWQRPFDALTVAYVALLSGVLLWNALFPGFYSMRYVAAVVLFWILVGGLVLMRCFYAALGARITGRPVEGTGAAGVVGLVVFVSAAVLLKLPLHAGFALARADLDRALARDVGPGATSALPECRYGIYTILQQARRRCHREERVDFTLANDTEAAFVHSPSGVDDLCYGSGSKGHLTGEGYWVVED